MELKIILTRSISMKIIKNVSLYGEITDISVEDGKIVAIGKTDAEGVDFGGNKIYPGLIDTHSHGCLAMDAMTGDLSVMADWYLANGTTTWYPTTMTMGFEDIVKATKANINLGHGANIPGFHLEGPFINAKYKGAQNEEYIVAPTMELLHRCDNVKKISLAPESEGAEEFVKECGVVVSVGHTDADYDTAMRIFNAGASCLTHTYNAMPGIHHRAPGPIGAGSDSPHVYAELICDGTHVHASAVRMLVKIFGEDRIVLISDSIAPAGVADGQYVCGGLNVTVKNGVALTEYGKIAGATSPLLHCVRTAIKYGIPEEVAVKMATENPARHMGLTTKGRIEVGYDADFIIVDSDFNLVKAIARGEF